MAYVALENGMMRRQALDELEHFIEAVESEPVEQHQPWAAMLAARVVDGGESLPVRMPLFRRVLMPALRDGYRRHLPGYARWLAGFSNLLFHTPQWDSERDGPATALALLRRALQDDPHDALARKSLVEEMATWLDYSVHEVPWGVLSGTNGATRDDMTDLQVALAEFVQLAGAAGLSEQYEDLVAECSLHFRAYEHYLAFSDRYESYEAYLDAEEPTWRSL